MADPDLPFQGDALLSRRFSERPFDRSQNSPELGSVLHLNVELSDITVPHRLIVGGPGHSTP